MRWFVGLNQYLPVDLAYALRYTLQIVPLSLLKMDRLTLFHRVTSGQHREVFGENENRYCHSHRWSLERGGKGLSQSTGLGKRPGRSLGLLTSPGPTQLFVP